MTSDNPFSQLVDGSNNESHRRELSELLAERGVSVRASVARDPSGQWPDEQGFAVLGQTPEFARVLARVFDQFAYYDVSTAGILVRQSQDARVLA